MAMQVGCRATWLVCETRGGVLHAKMTEKSVRGARRTSYAAGGLQLSTMCRRLHVDARDELVVIRVDEQDVKNRE